MHVMIKGEGLEARGTAVALAAIRAWHLVLAAWFHLQELAGVRVFMAVIAVTPLGASPSPSVCVALRKLLVTCRTIDLAVLVQEGKTSPTPMLEAFGEAAER